MTDLFLYASIRNYIYARIAYFTEHVLTKNLSIALATILGLLTLWVMIQGYLIATGRSQEGLRGFAYNLIKNYFIIAMALGVSLGGDFGLRTLTDTLTNTVSTVMTGSTKYGSDCLTETTGSILGCKIDRNLTATQSMMGILDTIDTADNEYLEGKISQARWFAGVGTAGPAVVAGTMLIMFRIAMALFVGFAPIFILCLLFKKTAPLFQKWLYYGMATIFSGVMLGVMSDISMELVGNIASPEVILKFTSGLLGESNNGSIMQTVTQQLGLGLILSTLLITVPPMAGSFFNGVMGNFNGYSLFSQWNASTPAQNGLPPQMGGSSLTQQQVSLSNVSTTQAPKSSANSSASISTGGYALKHTTGSSVSGTPVGQGDQVKTLSEKEQELVIKNLNQDDKTIKL